MGLRIRTNVESLTAQRNLGTSQTDLEASLEKLSSGSRINKSADDAAGLAVSENMRGKIRGLNQAKRNASDGISMLQVAESGLNEISNIMIRMRELSVQSASDTLGEKERGFLQKEYSQLTDEIDRISKTTEFNGRMLLGPNSEELEPQIQVGVYNNEDNRLTLKLGDAEEGINATSLGLRETHIDGTNHDEIASSMGVIDNALNMVANSRATIGATQSRLEHSITNISVSTENLSAANSRIRDVDYAEETAKSAQARILSQAGLSVLAQANQKPELALGLLRQ